MVRQSILIAIILIFFASKAFADKTPRSVIIDTDVGLDDVLAISYLLQQPSIQIKAITISATGETACLPAFTHLHDMLKEVGKSNIPVFCGRATPLQGNHRFPAIWSPFHEKIAFQAIKTNATEEITQLLKNASQPYDIIALGSLTNLGEVFQRSPELAQKVNMMYIMGGALHVPGNLFVTDKKLNKTAEWNFYIDPYAANIIFKSKLPITLIPLDLTNKVILSPEFYKQLQHQHTKTAKYLYKLFQSLPKETSDAMADNNWYAWDTLAAVVAIHPQFSRATKEKVHMQTEPDHDSGTLVIDNINGKVINACYVLDKEKFYASLVKSIS